MSRNSPDEEYVQKNGYELTFYPGFVSRAAVREQDGTEHELYRQAEPFRLPGGATRPKDRHRLKLEGGKRKQQFTFDIHDPAARIARITIELYGEDHDPEKNVKTATAETVTIENEPLRCPPNCGPTPPG